MVERSGIHPGRALLRSGLFVIVTLAGLFITYVLFINLAAAFGEDGAEWGQAVLVILPAAVVGVGGAVLRRWLGRR
jgi:hypothetical protein